MPAQLLTVSDIGSLVAPLSSPAFTDTPTAPTAATATSTTQLATTAFVQQELLAGGSTARSLVVSVRNQSGATMTAGTVVYINGSTGNLPTIAKAVATSDATSAQTLGMVQTSIANNGTGLVVVRGILGNLNTSGLTEGQQLYLSPTTAGAYTTTKQYAPNHLVYIGIVTRAHPTQGSIEVVVQNGFEMDELHDVSAQSPTNGDTLRYNSSTSLWEKSALGTLATQNGTFSGNSSGTNTGDQTISLTGDVTGSGTGSFAATIAANAVTNAKAAQVATQTIKGRNTAATGNVEDLSVATVKTMLNLAGTNTGDQTALTVANTPTGNIAATTVQAAINELDTEKTTPAAALAAAAAADLAATAALVEREGLRFDGTAQVPVSNSVGTALGSSDFTDIFEINCDSFGPNAQRISQRANTRGDIVIDPTGPLLFTSAIDSVQITGPEPTAGVPQIGVVVRSSAGVKISIDGGSTFTAPVANSTVMGALTGFGLDVFGATTFLKAKLSRYISFNYALTASEIAALTRRGLVTLPEQRGGSMVAIFSGDSSSFAGGVGNWGSNTLQAGSATVTTSGGKLSVSAMTGNEAGVRNDTNALTLEDGHSYTIGFTISNATGGSVRIGRRGTGNNVRAFKSVQILSGSGVVVTGTDYEFPNGTHRIRVIPAYNNAGVPGALYFGRGTNTTGGGPITAFELDDVTATLDGTLFEQDSGQRHAGYMVGDTSGNKLDLILPASGVSIIDPAQRGTIRFTTTTSGNQQIGGTQVIIPTNARITSWVINSSGTPNVTLGNVSAGAQYRASAAVVSGNNEITLLTRFTTTGNLWVNSSTTATLKHTIQWEYIQ